MIKLFNLRHTIVLLVALFALGPAVYAQNVSINATGAVPDSSAMLDIQSDSLGLLIPRMTKANRDNISDPAQGLLIFQTDNVTGLWMYDTAVSNWNLILTQTELMDLDSVLANGNDANGDSILNVGAISIGTTSPSNPLTVSALTPMIRVELLSDTTFNTLYSTNGIFPNGSNQVFRLDFNGTERFRFTDAGNFGIGTVPNEMLDVAGRATIDTLDVNSKYTFPSVDGTASGQVLTTDGAGNVTWENVGGGDTLGNHQMTQNLETGGNFISNDGDNEGLSVSANGEVSATPATTGAGNFAVFTNGDIRTNGQGTGVYFTNTAIGITGNNGNSGDMRLRTGNNTRIAISGAGNVAINAPSSGNALNVNGIADIDSVRVNNSYGLPTTDGANDQVLTTDGSGNVTWEDAGGAGDTLSIIQDDDADTKIQVEESNDEDAIRFDIAGTEYFRMDSGHFEILNTGNSVFIGPGAGASDNFGTNHNVFIGKDAGNANTVGKVNTAIGFEALMTNTSSYYNSALGHGALRNTTGDQNTGVGYNALRVNSTGDANTAVGVNALTSNTANDDNTAVGHDALLFSTGEQNTALGSNAGDANTTGANNVFVGYNTGSANTGDGNIFLGSNAGALATGINDQLWIDNSNTSTPLIYGDFAADSLVFNGQLTLDSAQDGSGYTFPGADGTSDQVLTTDGSGNVTWENAGGGDTLSIIQDDDADTKIQVEELGDEDVIRFDIAGTEYFRMDSGHIEVVNTGNSIYIGEEAGEVDDFSNSNGNVGIGRQALQNNTTGGRNVALGYQGLETNVTGTDNVAVGYNALAVSTGDDNTAVGSRALQSATTGENNVAVGQEALSLNTTGDRNVAVGSSALAKSDTANFNTAVGSLSMFDNTEGEYNTALGTYTLEENTTGDYNTAIGFDALEDNTTGEQNTAIGADALANSVSGYRNTAVGMEAGADNNGDYNTMVGHGAGENNTTGDGNVYLGYHAGQDATGNEELYIDNSDTAKPLIYGDFDADELTVYGTLTMDSTSGESYTFPGTRGNNGQVLTSDGSGNVTWESAGGSTPDEIADANNDTKIQVEESTNEDIIRFDVAGNEVLRVHPNGRLNVLNSVDGTFVGSQAGAAISSGSRNTFVGYEAGTATTTNSNNTFVGYRAGYISNATGNSAVGTYAGDALVGGANNTMFGVQAGTGTNSGDDNVFIGKNAGRINTTGDNNVYIGSDAGDINAGSDNVFIGKSAGAAVASGSDLLYIANSNDATPLIYGDFANDSLQINGQLNINGAFVFPTADGADDQVLTTDGLGNVAWENASAALSGGSTGKLARWSSATALDTSLIQDDGTSIGINTAPSSFQLVEASTNSSSLSTGIRGDHTLNSSTITRGVWGSSASTDKNNSAGVYGSASNGAYAIYGQSSSSDAGVVVINGYNSAGGSNANYGVKGQTSSSNASSAGLYGFAFHGGNALLASSNARVAQLNATSARTTSYNAVEINNTATASSSGIDKTALDIESTGSWVGAGNENIGLNVNVSGGTTNYAALFNGGNVGIGTTTPSGNLNVVSSGIVNTQLDGTNAAGTWLAIGNSSTGGKYYQLISTGPSNGEGTGKLLFGVGASAGGVQNVSMILDSNKLGIGIANPQYSLEALQGIRAGTNNFDGQYRLYSEQGATDYEVVFNPHSTMTQSTVYTLPADDGDASEVLTTDGSGNLSWGAAGSDNDWTVSGGIVYNSTDRFAVGTSSLTAGYFAEFETPTSAAYPLSLNIDNNYNGAAQQFGLNLDLSSASTGEKYGVYNTVTSNASQSNPTYGILNRMNANGSGDVHASYSQVLGTTSGNTYGYYASGEDYNYFSGFIGINDNTPSFRLEIEDNSTTAPFIYLQNTNTAGDAAIRMRGANTEEFSLGVDASTTNNDFVISNGTQLGVNNRLVIDGSNGDVGIGTTSPSTKLSVHTSGTSYGIKHSNGTIDVETFTDNTNGFGAFGTTTNHPFYLYMNDGNPLITLTSSTSVAIGNNHTTASSVLDVDGDIETGSADAFYFGDPSTNGTWRITRSGNNLVFERRESGSWVTKTSMLP